MLPENNVSMMNIKAIMISKAIGQKRYQMQWHRIATLKMFNMVNRFKIFRPRRISNPQNAISHQGETIGYTQQILIILGEVNSMLFFKGRHLFRHYRRVKLNYLLRKKVQLF